MTGSPDLLVVQTAIADYRDSFIFQLTERFKAESLSIRILVGEEYFDPTIKTSEYVKSDQNVKVVDNKFFWGRRASFQSIPISLIFNSKVVVCELNPRIFNSWIIPILRKLVFKTTYMWGHAWPRKGKDANSNFIRNRMKALASGLIVYTEKQKNELRDAGYKKKIIVAPNSLYPASVMCPKVSPDPSYIIYVGRLVEEKKVRFLVQSSIIFINNHPDVQLFVVGSGPEEDNLKLIAKKSGLLDRIIFAGHVSDVRKLKEYYHNSFVSVSPGYVGLSITQSISFGVPMLVSKDEIHSPEIEALRPGFNGDFFETDDVSSFLAFLEMYYEKKASNHYSAGDIVSDCQKRYSTEKMVKGFYDATVRP